ncbi:LysR family transcriptional regulator [Amycolatopsis palatopharyngis]|uniref:LysR family transcriptional regulator n=1 Tax=Amycolatopsis palatopharyngis TaxID=187982 RepID=UPI000E22C37A|nr:LysR family transcriptional regulator [Amycolatopsis palatopharyngis]
MLNVGRLQVLHVVAKLGSLTAAASELNYTTSSVSQQISLLERETESRLLERHPRGVKLTESGRVLAGHAGTVLADLRAAEAALTAVNRGQAGRLRFGSFPTANAVLMPQAVAAFQASHPHVSLELAELDRDEGLAAVGSHDLDLALVYEFPVVPITVAEGVETVPLLVDPLHIMLARDHPLASRGTLSLTDLADQRWIQGVHHGSTMNVLPQACHMAGFEPDILFRTDDQVTVRGLVAAGIGVALAPWLALSMLPSGVIARPLDEPTLIRTVLAALPVTGHRLPAAEVMVDTLSTISEELGTAPAMRRRG